MHKLRADVFFKAYEQAAVLHQTLVMLPKDKNVIFSPRDVTEQIERLTALVDELTALGLSGAATTINRAIDLLKAAPEVQYEANLSICLDTGVAWRIQAALAQGTSRIPDDLEGQVLLAVDSRRRHLYADPICFGKEVLIVLNPPMRTSQKLENASP